MTFSLRQGIESELPLQTDTMTISLRNMLWNATQWALNGTKRIPGYRDGYGYILKLLWISFFREKDGEMDQNDIREFIKNYITSAPWNHVYDFIEAFTQVLKGDEKINHVNNCNMFLENERSAYRIVDDMVVPIVNDTEIKLLTTTIAVAGEMGLDGTQIHLKTAIKQFSDRDNPDGYRLSLRESISAVESICCIIVGSDKATLGEALNKINSIIRIHGALIEAYKKLYGYTSDERGIRHSMLEEETHICYEDAYYFLVSCSSFVYYLIEKSKKAGILS